MQQSDQPPVDNDYPVGPMPKDEVQCLTWLADLLQFACIEGAFDLTGDSRFRDFDGIDAKAANRLTTSLHDALQWTNCAIASKVLRDAREAVRAATGFPLTSILKRIATAIRDRGRVPSEFVGHAERASEVLRRLDTTATTVEAEVDDDAVMSPTKLAETFHVPYVALRSRLARWRSKNLEGWIENPEPRPREARYLYQVGAVRHIINALKSSSQTSSERAAKKN